jgi:hypothetical protein
MLTPEQRVLRARMGGLALVAQGKTNTAPAREASPQSLDYWAGKVDPDNELREAEWLKRAEAARSQYMTGLALKSSRARSRKKASWKPKRPRSVRRFGQASGRLPGPSSVRA